MKIVYAITCTKNESIGVFNKNIKLLEKMFDKSIFILNSDIKQNLNNVQIIDDVGDMKESRHAILKKANEYSVNMWMILDSDILLNKKSIKQLIKSNFSKKYDFISLYYKNDPPIPAFFTLASSLIDFYSFKNKQLGYENKFFDDTEYNNPTYQTPTNKFDKCNIKNILFGKSYARTIKKFTKKMNEKDTTTGGATIYFNKELLTKEYKWDKFKAKSLTWYDSYRTFKITQENFKFAKVPIFVDHVRHEKSIKLSWDNVVAYILGYNKYMSTKDERWNSKTLLLHSIELYHYCKGMIKKIEKLNLNKEEQITMYEINKFLEKENIFNKEMLWK